MLRKEGDARDQPSQILGLQVLYLQGLGEKRTQEFGRKKSPRLKHNLVFFRGIGLYLPVVKKRRHGQ